MVQSAEICLLYEEKPLAEIIKRIINHIDDPFRCYLSLSMLCTSGNQFFHILFFSLI